MTDRAAAELIATLARAMQTAHEAGIVHRDLKPSNILFTRDGVPKIVDFGLAKLAEDEEGVSDHKQILGTPSYMAPEQAEGRAAEAGPAADVYALGVILYEMVTGRPPFKGPTKDETIRQVLHEEPVPPRLLQSRVSRDLQTICLKCLEKVPSRRYSSARELAADLDRFLRGEPIRARAISFWERGLKWARRRPLAATLWALGVLLAASAVGLGGGYARRFNNLRLESGDTLFRAQEAMRRDDLDRGQVLLAGLLARLEADAWLAPRLAAQRGQARSLLQQIDQKLAARKAKEHAQEERAEARQRVEEFQARRNEANFFATPSLGFEGPGRLEKTRHAAEAALKVFFDPGTDLTRAPAALPATLTTQEQADIIEGCYEMFLVRADAVAEPLPGEDRRQQAEHALRLLDQAGAFHPSPTQAYHLRRADCLARLDDPVGEAAETVAAQQREPTTALDHYLSGQTLYARAMRTQNEDTWRSAIHRFQAALSLQPDHFWAQCLLSICYLETQRFAEAGAHLTSCIQRQPRLAWLYLLRGHAFACEAQAERRADEATARFADAEADFRRAAKLGPSNDEQYLLRTYRGTMRFLRGQLSAAAADLEDAVQRQPDSYLVHNTLAQVYQQLQRPDEAIAEISKAIEMRPDVALLYHQRAMLRLALENAKLLPRQPDKALRDFEEAIQHAAPGNPLAATDYTQCARLLYQDGQFKKALEACNSALKIVPNATEAHFLRVKSLLDLNRIDEVMQSCDAFLSQSQRPSSALMLEVRGLARAARGDLTGAIADDTQAIALEPDNGRLYIDRGWVYYLADALKLAFLDFDRAVRFAPENPEAYAGRGTARIRRGEVREAVADAATACGKSNPPAKLLSKCARVYEQAALLVRQSGGSDLPRARAASYEKRRSNCCARRWERSRPKSGRRSGTPFKKTRFSCG